MASFILFSDQISSFLFCFILATCPTSRCLFNFIALIQTLKTTNFEISLCASFNSPPPRVYPSHPLEVFSHSLYSQTPPLYARFEVLVRSHAGPCGICGRQILTVAGFSVPVSFHQCSLYIAECLETGPKPLPKRAVHRLQFQCIFFQIPLSLVFP